jgi:hypothetical protein
MPQNNFEHEEEDATSIPTPDQTNVIDFLYSIIKSQKNEISCLKEKQLLLEKETEQMKTIINSNKSIQAPSRERTLDDIKKIEINYQ